MVSILRLVFDDKRYTTAVLVSWMVLTCGVFWHLGAFHTHFANVGPSANCVFLGLKIDTWAKWHCLVQFSFWNTAINEFLGSSLIPWFTNCIQVCIDFASISCINLKH